MALDRKELEIVIAAMEEKKYDKGVAVIKQGDQGDNLYVVESGTLNCVKKIVTILLNLIATF
jgi:cAMP-dependent protein kinase regulator